MMLNKYNIMFLYCTVHAQYYILLVLYFLCFTYSGSLNVKVSHVITALGLVVQTRGLELNAAVSDIESILHWSCDSYSSLSDPVKSELKTPKVLLVFVSGSFTRVDSFRTRLAAAVVSDIGLVEVVTLILACVIVGYKMMIAFCQVFNWSLSRSVYVVGH